MELDPHDIISSVVKCIDTTVENLEKLDIEPSDVVAIGLASQRCTAIAWEKITGSLLYPGCIMAADVRTQPLVDELKKVLLSNKISDIENRTTLKKIWEQLRFPLS